MNQSNLPIDHVFNDISDALKQQLRLILQAEPGAGKSTRLPLLLLAKGSNSVGKFSPSNQIIMLEPRRVAARQIAHYLAQQLGEKVGETVGLAMRGEHKKSSKTAITIVTDGVLVRMLQSDPELNDVGLVIFDEFHERALQSDLALAFCLDSQQINEKLALLIMSATLDSQDLASQLDAQVISTEGRTYPVTISSLTSDLRPSISDICRAIKYAADNHDSSILVFLTGTAEIKKVMKQLSGVLDDKTEVLPLYGGLTLTEQVQAIAPAKAGHRKVVLATNIAQTSLTIEGIDVVVDAGYEKSNQYQPRQQADVLVTQAISKAAAKQRAGRAGRLRPGFCYQLGDPERLARRREFDQPEITRSDLASLLIEVQAWGSELDQLYWPTEPPKSLISAAQDKLQALGFWEKNGEGFIATELAGDISKFGSDLRIVRLMHYAQQILSTDAERLAIAQMAACISDSSLRSPLQFLELFEKELAKQYSSVAQQTKKYAQLLGCAAATRPDFSEAVLATLAQAFPDRIAKLAGKRWKMSNGSAVEFHRSAESHHGELIIVVESNASDAGHFIQSFVPISLETIETYAADLLTQVDKAFWSESKQAPVAESRVQIGQLIVKSQPKQIKLSETEWQQLWLDKVQKDGIKLFGDYDKASMLLNRLALASKTNSVAELPTWMAESPSQAEQNLLSEIDEWLTPYLNNVKSFKALEKIKLSEILNDYLGWNVSQQLNVMCPTHYQTPAGNRVKIDYANNPPKISVRLQEMFGQSDSPSICQGQVKLLIELLSPAQRPLQLTQDLANYWRNAYQETKKEMRGRYPKHRWPDHPEQEVAGHSLKSRH